MGETTKKTSSRKDAFIFQAAILALAGLVSRVIGLLYAVPLYRVIGEEGNGYYGTAYEIYSIVLLISTYSIPTAVSKVISARIAVKEYKNAKRLFNCSLIYVLVVGAVAATLTFILAPFFVVSESVRPLRFMAPAIFFSGLLSVFRGYMQATGTMVPTAISQLFEQITNACVSVLMAWTFMNAFATQPDRVRFSWGAAGSATGTFAGVVAGLIFIFITFLRRRPEINKQVMMDETGKEDSYKDLFKIIFMMVTPIIMSTFIYNFGSTCDMEIFWFTSRANNIPTTVASKTYGIYTRQVIVLLNLPIAISTAVSSALVPGISGANQRGDREEVHYRIEKAIKTTMMVVIPAALGMAALSTPIMQLLFRGTDDRAGHALSVAFLAIICACISTLSNGILQAVGKVSQPVKNAFTALVIRVVYDFVVLYLTKGNVFALIGGYTLYMVLMCVFNSLSIRKYIGYKMSFEKIFRGPIISAIIMAGVTYGVFKGFYTFSRSNIVSLAAAVFFGMIIYFVVLIKVGRYSEEDILALPKGNLFVKIFKALKLI